MERRIMSRCIRASRSAYPDRDAAAVAGIYRSAVEGSTISFEETAPDANEVADRIR
ncbi:MAG: hypothetical protein H0V04_06715, partial [Chloroflexi bacterium]|nr:hypothetical protein [Chloroflexota bacterium]